MSTAAQIAANQINAESSTGPRTEEGKANSSRNSTRHGLFTQGDDIRPGEETRHQQLSDLLQTELRPDGPLEATLVNEILRATLRIERCAQAEDQLNERVLDGTYSTLDTFFDETFARLQTSIDRARTQAHRTLHKSTLELRRIQTERHYRRELFREGTDNSNLGICDFRSIMKGLAERDLMELRERKLTEGNLVAICQQRDLEFARLAEENRAACAEQSQFAERTQSGYSETPQFTERTQSDAVSSPDSLRNAA